MTVSWSVSWFTTSLPITRARPRVLSMRGAVQQLKQVVLPGGRHHLAFMAAALRRGRHQDRAALRQAPDLMFHDAELRRIDQVVRPGQCQQRRANPFQPWPWVVIVRSLELIQ